ncbi:MAG: hypothetical protein NVSMB26_29490 [Beijerinckiaceae bacterium]
MVWFPSEEASLALHASVYILRCRDGSYYNGITRHDVDERVSEHAQGIDPLCYTFSLACISGLFGILRPSR